MKSALLTRVKISIQRPCRKRNSQDHSIVFPLAGKNRFLPSLLFIALDFCWINVKGDDCCRNCPSSTMSDHRHVMGYMQPCIPSSLYLKMGEFRLLRRIVQYVVGNGNSKDEKNLENQPSCYEVLCKRQIQNFTLLIKLEDNRLIETVGIPFPDDKDLMRLTPCIS
ncbi:hypothetical protein FNV43_RR01472 [Rhamnella rubrinervis]|uniref:Uncharacterized protein n=1 Tax=Rhamnella rubrinervis TaxID=2594499 RepID=A0A8K0MT03_9ROSA|nr:hypothetical protein FNV43_RR01472 [Rhamnella rubrinervis]